MVKTLVARFAAWRGVLRPGARVRVAGRVGVVCGVRVGSLAPVGVRFDAEPRRTYWYPPAAVELMGATGDA